MKELYVGNAGTAVITVQRPVQETMQLTLTPSVVTSEQQSHGRTTGKEDLSL